MITDISGPRPLMKLEYLWKQLTFQCRNDPARKEQGKRRCLHVLIYGELSLP